MITATLRTNFYRDRPFLSFKLDPTRGAGPARPASAVRDLRLLAAGRGRAPALRAGRPRRAALESDRPQDFRTEVLGLVKAQTVKNAVIVPGRREGRVRLQAAPTPATARLAAEGMACYRTFISGLLDVTDNLVEAADEIVPPPDVVRHDGDDPYLVVAADKGTATFSDIANERRRVYGFWLGDAFASGGSVGLRPQGDGHHRARGLGERASGTSASWASTPRREEFTVVGVGDMSGDVFGNGMLLSAHIRLVAAFDHRHVFLDPTPDAARGVRRAASGCSSCRARRGTTTTGR